METPHYTHERDCLNHRRGRWSPEEDTCLKKSIELYGEKHWRLISEGVPGRSAIQCLHRWSKILRPGLVKGPWSVEEDKVLLDWVHLRGARKWSDCAAQIPGRNGKQCRERWCNTLSPDIKKGHWTDAEDKVIFEMYASLGARWTLIAKQLPGRTENSIKNRFYSASRKKQVEGMFEDIDFLAEDKTEVGSQETGMRSCEEGI